MNASTRLLQTYPDKAARALLRTRGFRSLYITTDTDRHHVYTAEGSGPLPPLVFLHGGSDSAATFAPVMLWLRKYAQAVIAIEAAGHGLSHDPEGKLDFTRHYSSMNTVLDKVIEQPAVLVGNSLGALTAIHYANHNPARVKGLVLLSPMGAPMTAEHLEELRTAFTPKSIKETHAFIERTHPSISLWRKHLVAPLTFAWLTRPAISDLVHGSTTDDVITPAQLQKIHVPTCIIAGKQDKVMAPNTVEYFRSHLVGPATILQPKNMGHCPQHDQPKTTARMIFDFVKRID